MQVLNPMLGCVTKGRDEFSISNPENGDRVIWKIESDESDPGLLSEVRQKHADPTITRRGAVSKIVTVGELRETFARWVLGLNPPGGPLDGIFRVAWEAMRLERGIPSVKEQVLAGAEFRIERAAEGVRQDNMTVRGLHASLDDKFLSAKERAEFARVATLTLNLAFEQWGLRNRFDPNQENTRPLDGVLRATRNYLMIHLGQIILREESNPLVEFFGELKGDRFHKINFLKAAKAYFEIQPIDRADKIMGRYNQMAIRAIEQLLESRQRGAGRNTPRKLDALFGLGSVSPPPKTWS